MFGIRVKTGHKNTAEDVRVGKTITCMRPKLACTRHAKCYVKRQVSEKGSANQRYNMLFLHACS
jgi:hypothetical protein